MNRHGKKIAKKIYDNSQYLRTEIKKLHSFRVITEDITEGTEFGFDYSKVFITSQNLSGFQLVKRLREKFKIQPEKFDEQSTLFLITPADSIEDMKRIICALDKIERAENDIAECIVPTISPDKVSISPFETVSINKSNNKISAESIIPYPPCVPILLIGEKITKKTIQNIEKLKQRKTEVHGIHDTHLNKIRILRKTGDKI
jgi:arginine/lysine/ornithine decarboxylase